MKIVIAIVTLFVLGGCTATGPLFTETQIETKAVSNESKIFVYRVDQFAGAGGAVTFLDNGRNVGAMYVEKQI